MLLRSISLTLTVVIFLGVAPMSAAAQAANPDYVVTTSGWPNLMEGVSFEEIETATMDELLIAASLVAISRNTFAPEYSVLGGFDDGLSSGAMLLYVEKGPIYVVPNVDPGSVIGPTLLIQTGAEDPSSGPQLIVPETQLSLNAGDLLAPPVGTDLFIMNQQSTAAEGLILTIFPGQVSSLQFGTSAIQLEVDLGLETVREAAPPIVSAGRLTFVSDAGISDHQSLWPRIVFVESGSMTMVVDGEDGQIRRAGANAYDPVDVIGSGAQDTLGQGDAAYIPPGATVSIVDGGEGAGSLLSLTVVLPAEKAAAFQHSGHHLVSTY